MLKAWQPFNDKVRHLMKHMQMIDAALSITESVAKSKNEAIKLNKALGKPSYTHLNELNTKRNINRTIAFSRSKLHERVVIDLYRYFSEFISETIREINRKNPKIFLSDLNTQKQKDISFADIIRIGNYTSILDEMALRVYRGLEREQSTKKLLKRFIKVTSINIPNDELEKSLLYLEVRHLIIHNAGKTDDKFNSINSAKIVKLDKSGYIKMNYVLTNKAIKQIYKLAGTIKNQIDAKYTL